MSKVPDVGVADSYASYDAATGKYEAQTRQQFYDSLTADIEKALGALAREGVLNDPPAEAAKPPAKSLREIQAEEEAAAAAKTVAEQKMLAAATAELERQERIQCEKAAAEAAWNADRAARDAAGHKPCWICWQYASETKHHAPKRDICPTATRGFYVWDRSGQPNTAYARKEFLEEGRALEAAARRWPAANRVAAPQHGLAEFLDVSGGLVAPAEPAGKKGKSAKKPTVEKFSLDEI